MQMYRKDFGIPNIKQYLTVCSIKKKTFKDLELSIFCHIFATSKDTHKHTHSHIHPHNRVFFEHDEIFINNKGRVQ